MIQCLKWLRYHRTVVANRVAKNKLQLLRSEKLSKLAWLVHAFSTRHGGVSRAYGGNALNLGFTQHDSRAAVERNRMKRRLREAVRLHWPELGASVDVVINPKKSLLTTEFSQVGNEISRAFEVIQKKVQESRKGTKDSK